MAKKAPNNDSFVDLAFPVSGIDLTTEFEEQRQGTTQEGVNVRTYEPILNRARGGQRAGLGRYIDHTVGVLDAEGSDAPGHVIQHLAIIVDPTVEGLLSDDDLLGGPRRVNDPSTSNRRLRIPLGQTRTVRAGGTGASTQKGQPRKTLTITAVDQTKQQGDVFTFAGTEFSSSGLEILDSLTTATLRSKGSPATAALGDYPITISNVQGSVAGDGSGSAGLKKKYRIKYVPGVMTVEEVGDIVFVQARSQVITNGTPIGTLAFTSDVVSGNLLLVAIRGVTNNLAGINSQTVTDSQGNSYTQLGAYSSIVPGSTSQFSVWRAFANASGPNTVTCTQLTDAGSPLMDLIGILEYHGVAAAFPLDDAVNHNDLSPSGLSTTTGNVQITESGELLLGFFSGNGFVGIMQPDVNFTAQLTDVYFNVFEWIGPAIGNTPVTGTFSLFPPLAVVSIGISLKKA
jgi:hypothetical protein